MAQQITPLAPSLPATTAIQDPAARRFAQAVQDALGALRSEAGAVESLNKAAAALAGTAGGTPASIAQWLLTSELYQKLKSEIVAVDVQAKQDLLDEAIARQNAIEEIQAALANIEATPEYDPLETYAVGDMVTYTGKLYRALLETTGNLPTNLTYWEKIGDYASLGEAVSAHALAIADLEYSMYNPAGEVQAEVAARQTLATQMRGTYAGTDIAQVTQGLMYSERVARSSAYDAEVAARQSLATKVLGQADPTGLTLATLTSGLIFEEAQVRSDVDGSLAQTIDALEVTMGENIEAAMLAEQTVRAGNDNALVSAINTAWAFTGATQAVSQSGQNLITNWTAAQANRWSQLEAEVFTAGGKTIRAALSEEAQVRANADGSLGAQWTIKTDINGYISGFGFASTANNAAPTSEFIIRADKFAVVMPGYGEHVPFAIGPSGADFLGNVTGTVNGTSASTLVSTANTALTNANAAQTAANTANAALADIAADNKLTPAEKKSVRKEWDAIYAERAGIRAQADSFGITTEKTNYDNDFQALGTYLNGGTAYTIGATPPSWITDANLATTTAIVGTTFRANWSNLYSDRQALMNKIAAVAATKADWASVSGSGKPANNATVGATFGDYNGAGRNISGTITPGNVTTYIANAAIGNAQIGGDIYSDLWNSSGNTQGWYLQRNGNLYCANAYVRGNVEASSLKANTAMVGTAHIGGLAVTTAKINNNAVTIPVSAYTTAEIAVGSVWTTIQSVVCDPEGGAVSLVASVMFYANANVGSIISVRLLAPSGAQVGYISSSTDSTSSYSGLCLTGRSTQGGTYLLQGKVNTGVSSLTFSYRSLIAIGSKK